MDSTQEGVLGDECHLIAPDDPTSAVLPGPFLSGKYGPTKSLQDRFCHAKVVLPGPFLSLGVLPGSFLSLGVLPGLISGCCLTTDRDLGGSQSKPKRGFFNYFIDGNQTTFELAQCFTLSIY